MRKPSTNKTNQAEQKRPDIERDPATGRPLCPECKTVMGKKEERWSGRHKKRLWLCSACGRTKLLPLDFLPEDAKAQPAPAAASLTESVVADPRGGNHHRRPCDGIVEGKPRPCGLSEDGYCGRLTYPMSCLKYKREDWEKLPMDEKGRGA